MLFKAINRHLGTSKRRDARPAALRVIVCERQHLVVSPDPTDNNPIHAKISGWPNDKPAQKVIALEIAAAAAFVARNQ